MTLLAHGLGGAADLPIPLTYALIGAAWALTFSFAVIAFAWRDPRLEPDSPGIACGDRDCEHSGIRHRAGNRSGRSRRPGP